MDQILETMITTIAEKVKAGQVDIIKLKDEHHFVSQVVLEDYASNNSHLKKQECLILIGVRRLTIRLRDHKIYYIFSMDSENATVIITQLTSISNNIKKKKGSKSPRSKALDAYLANIKAKTNAGILPRTIMDLADPECIDKISARIVCDIKELRAVI